MHIVLKSIYDRVKQNKSKVQYPWYFYLFSGVGGPVGWMATFFKALYLKVLIFSNHSGKNNCVLGYILIFISCYKIDEISASEGILALWFPRTKGFSNHGGRIKSIWRHSIALIFNIFLNHGGHIYFSKHMVNKKRTF